MLKSVKWGEYEISKLFEKLKVNKLNYKTQDLPEKPNKIFCIPALTAGIQNQGLNNYVPKQNATVLRNVISVSANGANTGATFYQKYDFTILQDAYAINWIYTENKLSDNQYLFLVGALSKSIYGNYAWTNKAGWEKIKKTKINLPIKNNAIDLNFMEKFITKVKNSYIEELKMKNQNRLQAYLNVAGISDYKLSEKEEKTLNKKVKFKEFNLLELFGKSTRGKRLKSSDRIPGDLPFVTAGETNDGISDFIGNDVIIFSKNTVTIDMFGSAKYRNYDYGADDHIAVVHTEKISPNACIYIAGAIHKSSYNGQFTYGRNFYAKDADALMIFLPVKNNAPDYDYMETYIKALQKLIIADVQKYADTKIAAATKAATANS